MPNFELPPVGSKTRYIRVPPPGIELPPGTKNIPTQLFNTTNVKGRRFGYEGVGAEYAAYNEGLDISYPDIAPNNLRIEAAQRAVDLSNAAQLEYFGPQRPRASGVYDPNIAPGRQYQNNSPMPIDFQGNRRGGVYDTGEAINTRFANFAGNDDLVEDPTTTTNVSRPRTVAAAYEPDEEKLTIVFRDGTFYNYYEVTSGEWEKFRNSYSKGPYISQFLDGKPRGVASVGDIPEELLKHSFVSSRLNQIGKLTKSHAHSGKFRPAQTMVTPPKRTFSKSNGYRTPPKAPRGIHVKKSASAPVAPTAKSVNAATRRRNTMRALGGK